MENNYSNYDMLDKLITNSRKARSWTIFWVVLLCVMAAAVLWLANTITIKNKTIRENELIIASNQEILEMKSRIIDSLTENCNTAKTALIKDYDSVITKTEKALAIVSNESQPGGNIRITAKEQATLATASNSIQQIKADIRKVETAIRKDPPRLFIQYNNKDDERRVDQLLSYLKEKAEYVVAPAEFVDKSYAKLIKFYNYKNVEEESNLKRMISRAFRIDPNDIKVIYETNEKIKPTVEIWLGTKPIVTRPASIQLKNR